MKRDTSETPASNGEETVAAQQHLPSARSSPVSLGRVSAFDTPNNSLMEALLLQVFAGDLEAWAGVEQCLGETIRCWLHGHPSKEAACCWESEEHYISLAFERPRQAVTTGQLRAYTSPPTVLRYLQACLNAVLLDLLRAKGGAKGITLQEPAHAEEQAGGDHSVDNQLWERIQHLFPDLRECRVAFLLFHCHLSPRDIFCLTPHQFKEVQEICHIRRHMLEQILLQADLMLSSLPLA